MVDVGECIERALSILNSKTKSTNIILKREQELAIQSLLRGQDVLAVLPTGFGKSMIFTVYGLAEREMRGQRVTVFVISPLKSIIVDQLAEMDSVECTASELTNDTIESILKNPPQFVYSTAEQALEERFLAALKDCESEIHHRTSAVIVDESHTVETWTGKRKVKGRFEKQAFREAYGKLSILRSMCREGVPFLALTGTADNETQRTIMKELIMKDATNIFVSPNRVNLKFSVVKVKKEEMLSQLNWLVELVKEKGVNTPKTILFCPTLVTIASVVNWLMMMLGESAFHPPDSRERENCVIGIFHSLTLQYYKERVTKSLKQDGVKRIVVATTALSMGVNFPDIRKVIMFGPARSILDFHQEAGRAGRDGCPSEVILYYHGQQTAHCEDEVRVFLKSTGCIRVAAYASLDPKITSLQPKHDCCSICSSECKCQTDGCLHANENKVPQVQLPKPTRKRDVKPEEKVIVREALKEMLININAISTPILPFGSTAIHGFSDELIEDVISNCESIFCLEDVLTFVPVFSTKHAITILCILNDIFDDCDQTLKDSSSREIQGNEDYDIDFLLNSKYGDNTEEVFELDYI